MTRKCQSGLTLIELMIAIAIALMVLAAMSQAFVNTSAVRTELDRAGRQVENGRYALDLLGRDLKLAGFYGAFSGDGYNVTAPADICAVGSAAALGWSGTSYPAHVTGFNNTSPSCVIDRKAGTDVIVIRRVSTEPSSIANAGLAANQNGIYLQTAGCAAQGTAPVIARGSAGAATFNLTEKDCTTPSDLRQFIIHVYYVWSGGAGTIPTLRRREFRNGAWQNAQDLVEGIEEMRFEYAVDTDGDGTPDQSGLTAASIASDCAAASPANVCWENVISTTAYLIARNTEATAGYADSKSYRLGSATPISYSGTDAGFKRHVYSVTIPFANPAGRRE